MPRPHPLHVTATIVALALTAAGCGGDDQDASGSGSDSVTIYSGRTEDLVQPILDAFTDETGIDVDVKYGSSADLALLIEEEAAADRVRADVFLSQSPGSLGYLEQNGRLAELPDATLDLVPAGVRDDDGRWIGFSGRQRVLNYNTELVDPADLADSVLGMTDPEWNGRIGVAPGNGSFQDFVTAMRATEGDDATRSWLEGIAANDPVTYPTNSAIVAAVGRGEIEVGLVNHYYNFRALDEDPNVPSANHYFDPGDPGAILIVTGAAIVDGSERADSAARLIEFLLGPEGQRYFASETFEYPLAIGAPLPGDLPPLDFAAIDVVHVDDLAGGLEQTRQMIADAGLEG